MGDVEYIIEGFIGAMGAGLVGIVHGALDSTEYSKELSPIVHEALTYIPFLSVGAFAARDRYGAPSKIRNFTAFSAIASAFEGAGYLVGKVMGYGTQRILEL